MAVHAGWAAVSSPSCVCDTSVRVENLGSVGLRLLDELLEFGDLADLLEGQNLILFVTVDREAGRIVATVF